MGSGLRSKAEDNAAQRLGFNGAANILAFVSAKIVHHDDIARFKDQDEDPVHISLEAGAVHEAVEHHWRGNARACEPGL